MGLVTVLLFLLLFSYLKPGLFEPKACRRQPEQCIGQQIQLSHGTKVSRLVPNGFIVDQLGAKVLVIGDNTGLRPGDRIQLRGLWQADGTIRAETWHVSRERRWRVWLSIPAALLAGWLFWRSFRWDPRQLALTTRQHA